MRADNRTAPVASATASPDATALAWAHPVVREWFIARFGSATEPQAEGWPAILGGRDTLITAPTGSGKTLAAFMACIDTDFPNITDHGVGNRHVENLRAQFRDRDRPLSTVSRA